MAYVCFPGRFQASLQLTFELLLLCQAKCLLTPGRLVLSFLPSLTFVGAKHFFFYFLNHPCTASYLRREVILESSGTLSSQPIGHQQRFSRETESNKSFLIVSFLFPKAYKSTGTNTKQLGKNILEPNVQMSNIQPAPSQVHQAPTPDVGAAHQVQHSFQADFLSIPQMLQPTALFIIIYHTERTAQT